MKYNSISSYALVSKAFRDFHISTSDWVVDAIEWLGEGLSEIGYSCGTTQEYRDITIKNHMAKLPCGVEDLLACEYKGSKLDLILSVSANRTDYNGIKGDWYYLNPGYIHTSFATGTVRLYVLTIPKDDKGFPMIPDEVNTHQALSWLIVYHTMLRGYSHPTIKDWKEAFAMWDITYKPRAQNALVAMSLDEALHFKRRWTSICNSFNYEKSFFDEPMQIGGRNADISILPYENTRIIGSSQVSNDDEDLELSSTL